MTKKKKYKNVKAMVKDLSSKKFYKDFLIAYKEKYQNSTDKSINKEMFNHFNLKKNVKRKHAKI